MTKKRLPLYPFRYRNQVTGKWVGARYAAELPEIEARYAHWEIIGAPEIREVDDRAAYFHPYRVTHYAQLNRLREQPPQINPHLERPPAIDAAERFLVGLFLRRYAIYCVRRGRFAEMHGARTLYREVARS